VEQEGERLRVHIKSDQLNDTSDVQWLVLIGLERVYEQMSLV